MKTAGGKPLVMSRCPHREPREDPETGAITRGKQCRGRSFRIVEEGPRYTVILCMLCERVCLRRNDRIQKPSVSPA